MGKGSKMRPEAIPGSYAKNYERIFKKKRAPYDPMKAALRSLKKKYGHLIRWFDVTRGAFPGYELRARWDFIEYASVSYVGPCLPDRKATAKALRAAGNKAAERLIDNIIQYGKWLEKRRRGAREHPPSRNCAGKGGSTPRRNETRQ